MVEKRELPFTGRFSLLIMNVVFMSSSGSSEHLHVKMASLVEAWNSMEGKPPDPTH
jgi:hypothetical protein